MSSALGSTTPTEAPTTSFVTPAGVTAAPDPAVSTSPLQLSNEGGGGQETTGEDGKGREKTGETGEEGSRRERRKKTGPKC